MRYAAIFFLLLPLTRTFSLTKILANVSKRPTQCTQQNTVLQPWRVDLVDAKKKKAKKAKR
jgi:hypothetical protein